MIDLNHVIRHVRSEGFAVINDAMPIEQVKLLREEIESKNRIHNQNIRFSGDLNMIHNCHEVSINFLEAYQHPYINECLSELLGNSYIIYAFQSSSLPGNGTNYARRIHCDSPRFIKDYITNVGVILALDSYTEHTGAIEFLPYSFNLLDSPSKHDFESNSRRIHCNEGSIIIFNARTFHREGINSSNDFRHSLTCNFCRCYMRQRFDFVRMAQASGLILNMTDHQRKLIGYNVRIPTSLDEFFLPPDKRMYLSGQE